MCCLKYEHPLYAEFAREAPAVGSAVTTDEGDGVVVAHQVPADSVVVRMSDSGPRLELLAKAGVCGSRQAFATRTEELPPATSAALAEPSAEGPAPEPADADDPGAGTSARTGKPRTRRRRRTAPPS